MTLVMPLFKSRKADTPTFDLGPEAEHIKQLVHAFDQLPEFQVDSLAAQTLDAERAAVIDQADTNLPYADAVRDYAGTTGDALWRARDAAEEAGTVHTFNRLPDRFAKNPKALTAAALAARGLFTRNLIGTAGYTQDDYDTLTGPWRRVVGSIHPADPDAPTTPDHLTRVWADA